MTITFDQAWAEAAASAPDNTTFIDTLEVNHAAFTAPIRVCNSFEDLVGGGMTFKPYFFEFDRPDLEANVLPQLIVRIGNLNKTLRQQLQLASETATSATVLYRQWRVVGATAVLGEYMQIPIPVSSIHVPSRGDTISITCEPPNVVNLPLHRAYYTLERFIGLRGL